MCKTCLVRFSGSGDVEAYLPSLHVLCCLICDLSTVGLETQGLLEDND